jgi:hypothetical protein
MNSDSNKPLWTRFDGESSQAFDAFTIYRDMGPHRSYNKVVKELGAKASYIRQIQRWARTYKWKFRADSYDDHLDGIKLQFKHKELEKLHREALSHSWEVLQNLIDITNGVLPASRGTVDGIESYFRIIGLIRESNVR